MAPIRQVSHRQFEILVEFAEAHRNIVLGNIGKGPLGQQEANKAWEVLTRQLNSIGGGVIKTPANWKRYWHLLKCRTKGKSADLRRSHVATGGGPNKTIPLSDLEERIVAVIGKVAVEGIPEVRIPLNLTAETQPSSSSSTPDQLTALSSSIEMGLENNVDMELEGEVLECEEVELDSSLIEPNIVPASFTAELTSCRGAAGSSSGTLGATGSSRGTLGAVGSSSGTLGATGSSCGTLGAVGSSSGTLGATLSSRGTLGAAVSSQASQRSSRPRPLSEPTTTPASSASEPASSAAPEPRGTSAGAAGRSQSQPQAAQRSSRPRRNRDENLPGWAYELEDRRIAVEERLVNEIAGLGATNRGILECLQQLLQMLQAHLE